MHLEDVGTEPVGSSGHGEDEPRKSPGDA
jgi:hypothetical protein